MKKPHPNAGRKRPDLIARNKAMAKHGHSRGNSGHGTPTYKSWCAMMERAHRGTGKDAHRYFHKNIRVCERWLKFENFLADMGERPPGKTLDRVDGSRWYAPDNCRWASPREQALNTKRATRITAFGVTKHITEWERETGISRQIIRHRLRVGWPLEEALSAVPDRSKNSRWARGAHKPAKEMQSC